MPRRSLLTALFLLSLTSPAHARPLPADPPLPPRRAEARNGSHRDEAGAAALVGVAVLAAVTVRRRRRTAA